MGVAGLGQGGEVEVGDGSGPEDQAVGRSAELEVAELGALVDVVTGCDAWSDEAGGHFAHADGSTRRAR